jgi:hypothetical protein
VVELETFHRRQNFDNRTINPSQKFGLALCGGAESLFTGENNNNNNARIDCHENNNTSQPEKASENLAVKGEESANERREDAKPSSTTTAARDPSGCRNIIGPTYIKKTTVPLYDRYTRLDNPDLTAKYELVKDHHTWRIKFYPNVSKLQQFQRTCEKANVGEPKLKEELTIFMQLLVANGCGWCYLNAQVFVCIHLYFHFLKD